MSVYTQPYLVALSVDVTLMPQLYSKKEITVTETISQTRYTFFSNNNKSNRN